MSLTHDHEEDLELDTDERDDARQMIAVGLAGVQRERAAAEAHYVRGRNVVTFTATLFAAAQAAVIANVGKLDAAKQAVLSDGELDALLYFAAVAAVLLLVAVVMLFIKLDRPRDIDPVGGEKLQMIWEDRYGQNAGTPRLMILMKAVVEEEKSWSVTNSNRVFWGRVLSIACALAALVALGETVTLLFSIR